MSLITPFYLDCVVAIGIPLPNDEKQWIGTGFIVGRYNKEESGDSKQYNIFLVTNKHVIAGKEKIVVRFNKTTNAVARDYEINLESVQTKVEHQTHDIVVISFNPQVLEQDKVRFSFFRLDENVFCLKEMKEAGISEGDSCFILGFPLGIVSPERQYVIVRSGIIARIRDVIDQMDGEYMIDANIFPGNSGSPVILKPEVVSIHGTNAVNRSVLIGIIESYIPYEDVAVSLQTRLPRVVFQENSGLASVIPVDYILETVDIAFKLLPKH